MSGKRVKIIAEIGINHNGDLDIAKKLIDMAVFTGCDAVKFQKRTPELCVPNSLKEKRKRTPWGEIKYVDYRKKVEFGKKEYTLIDDYCSEKKIDWFASAWDTESQDFLRKFDLKYNKIASAMLTYIPLLKKVAEERKHTFISTDMSSLEDINRAVEIFLKEGCPYELNYTVSKYPCDPSLIDLKCIPMLQKRYGCPVGYSGHEVMAYSISLGAVALGAASIERHITLDRTTFGRDQSSSLEVMGLLSLVRGIRTLEETLGDGQKKILAEELSEIKRLRWFEN